MASTSLFYDDAELREYKGSFAYQDTYHIAPQLVLKAKITPLEMLRLAAVDNDSQALSSICSCIMERSFINEPLDEVDGRTALFIAVQYGHQDLVKCIIDLDAEVNVTNAWGWTPVSKKGTFFMT